MTKLEAYAAAVAADNALQCELVRAYGKKAAGNMRYAAHHDDAAVVAALAAKKAADAAMQAAA